jgi:NhaA family Na+:H+ antiporter
MSRIPARSHGKRTLRAERSYVVRQAVLPIEKFIHSETTGAIVLFAAAVVALVWANSPWSGSYFAIWREEFGVRLGHLSMVKDLRHWINDGFMAVFFFVVGLEIKRELVQGELASVRQAALPAIAAFGGMMLPGCIYLAFNAGGPAARGWGIPMATDIAFAVGVLALVGRRIPPALRTLLLALAIADDLGAILVIAVFYTSELSPAALGVAALILLLFWLMRKLGVTNSIAYAVASLAFWAAILESGVHATIAGVILGFMVPVKPWFTHKTFADAAEPLLSRFRAATEQSDEKSAQAALGEFEELTLRTESAAERLERELHPLVSYAILPLFAFANAGVSLSATPVGTSAANRIALGVALGLLLGKVLGIVGFSWASVKLQIAALPGQVTFRFLIGMGLVAGIGFTVSLFITNLAFEEDVFLTSAKLGILGGSLLSGLLGYIWLRFLTEGKTYD